MPFVQERVLPHHAHPASRRCRSLSIYGRLKAEGVQSSIRYPRIHHFKNFEGKTQFLKMDLVVTENVGMCEVTFPLYPTMKDGDVKNVVNAIQNQTLKMK
jgi:dTDP-4-amino-4,6-dideoxygalactose transaminase